MGNVDFNQFKNTLQNRTNNSNANTSKPRVGFFSLKNDKDFAIVRFMIDKPEDFDIVAGHRMNVGGFNRMVSCVRDAHEPTDNCPLCAAGKKLEYKFYIHLIQYVQDTNGKLIPTPKVWERSTVYVDDFNNKLNTYGPLSDCLFKVTRNGAAGSQKTTYSMDFIPATSPVYPPDLYKKDNSFFEGYKAVGNAVINYNKDKLVELLSTSTNEEEVTPKAPVTNNVGFRQPINSVEAQNYQASASSTYTQAPQNVEPQYNANRRFVPTTEPVMGDQVDRPVRRTY